MRTTFIEALMEVAARDSRVWLVCGDLGFSVLEPFAAAFPDRFLNAGVAEQNMTGIAAGLALSGKIVFTYSIANFPVMRCLEQIRNDVCYHNLNVKVVAVGGGFAYGSAGYTHHGVEDLAVLRAFPNLKVAAPADPVETRFLTHAAASLPGPFYLRLGKAREPVLHAPDTPMEFGKAIAVRTGRRGTLIAVGSVLGEALRAADLLAARGIDAAVLSMPTIVPFDENAVLRAARDTGRIVTVEEHGPGGLASAVAEVIAGSDLRPKFSFLRLRREPVVRAGSQADLLAAHGITAEAIAERMTSLL